FGTAKSRDGPALVTLLMQPQRTPVLQRLPLNSEKKPRIIVPRTRPASVFVLSGPQFKLTGSRTRRFCSTHRSSGLPDDSRSFDVVWIDRNAMKLRCTLGG